jgi:transposase
MAKIKTVALSELERTELQKGCRDGATFGYRQRCQIILLKADCRTSKEVAKEVGCCEVVVNRWLNRYQEQGISGLAIRAGRGRRSILQKESDLEAVRRAVQKNRQKISLAKAELTQELGKEFSVLTLKRFLKKTVAVTNECGA